MAGFVITEEPPVHPKLPCTPWTVLPRRRRLPSWQPQGWGSRPGRGTGTKASLRAKSHLGRALQLPDRVKTIFVGSFLMANTAPLLPIQGLQGPSRPSGPCDMGRGWLSLTGWCGADGLAPINCTLVASGWNKIIVVVINVIIIIARLLL